MDVKAAFGRYHESCRARRARSHYPAELREQALEYVQERRAQGASLVEVARELGVAPGSLRSWAQQESSSREMAPLRRVQLIDGEGGPRERRIVVRGPRGLVVEGLDVQALAELFVKVSA